MPKTIEKTAEGQVIGGIFNNMSDADKAVVAFEAINILPKDIAVITGLEGEQAKIAHALLSNHRFGDPQAANYEKLFRDGKVLVVVSEVTNPGPVIGIFDRYHAQYNPDGSRNGREDVSGMTAGAAIGAAAGGAIGAVVAGPIGVAAGGLVGGIVGAGAGAAAGTAAEHSK